MRTRSITAALAVIAASATTAAVVVTGGTAASAASGTSPRAVVTSTDHGRADFGYAAGSFTSGGKRYLRFDRAVMLTGAAAAEAKRAHGIDPTEPPDHYIQNDNPKLRVYRLAPNVVVVGSQVLTGTPQPKQVPLQRLLDHMASRRSTGPALTLEFRAGQVVTIREVYLA